MYYRVKYLVLEKIEREFSDYALHDKFYKSGMVSFWIYMAIAILTLVIAGQEYLDIVVKAFGLIIVCTCTIGTAIEYWRKIKELFEKTWFKWALGVISILIYKYSESQSDDFINKYTGIDPAFLPTASSVLSAVYLPYSWLVSVSLFLSIYVIFHWLFIPFEKTGGKRPLENYKYIMRFMGLVVIFFAANNLTKFFEDDESLASLLAKEIIIRTEYFPKSHCINIASSEISADIGRGYSSIFSPENSSFRTGKCEIAVTGQSASNMSGINE